MKNLIYSFLMTIVIIIFSGSANAQVTQEWVGRYNGPVNGAENANAIAVDGSGNVYVTGYSMGSGTGSDYATIKYNSAGVVQWISRFNGLSNGDDIASAIAVDALGNVYVTGSSTGIGTGVDYATVKYNSNGILQWVSTYNGTGNNGDFAASLAVDGSGNVYVTGYSGGSGTANDYATIKYNSIGAVVWISRYNGPGNSNDLANAIAIDGSGNVYVTGYSQGSGTAYDYATVKYNSIGAVVWISRYNGPGNGDDLSRAIAIDGSGNVYVTGFSGGSGTSNDYATIKYDNSTGAAQWVSRYNGPGNSLDFATSIAIDVLGNVYVTGYSIGSGTFQDYSTIKYNPIGIEQWVSRYNGPGNNADIAYSLAVDGPGNVYVSGFSAGSGTGNDYATIKYNSAGVEQWVSRYNGPGNGNDIVTSLVIDISGNVYVTGLSTGSGTGTDYATIKYSQECHVNVSAGSDTTIYYGYGPGTATLTANVAGGTPPYSYLWSNNSTSQTITVNPTVTTSYIVNVHDVNNCTGGDTVIVNVIDVRCGNNLDKVIVCHNGHDICISPDAVPAHLAHGDHLGSCNLPVSFTPKPNNSPAEFKLYSNYPNPFNPVTRISFDVPEQGLVSLKIYDVLGNEVNTIVNEVKSPGKYMVDFNGTNLSSGVYFYVLKAGSFSDTKKMLLIK